MDGSRGVLGAAVVSDQRARLVRRLQRSFSLGPRTLACAGKASGSLEQAAQIVRDHALGVMNPAIVVLEITDPAFDDTPVELGRINRRGSSPSDAQAMLH